MAGKISPVENHREREKGVLVYPVYSRRSGGLSVGINLFPDKKNCPFDCPYCEVFPFKGTAVFSVDQMEDDLSLCIGDAREKKIPIKDICFSGNGEPSIAPLFPLALEAAAAVHSELELQADTEIVIITNGAGLLQPEIFSLLNEAAQESVFNIWLKLDAGTEDWYKKINRSNIPYNKLISKIKKFTAAAPVTIQTMLCAVDGNPPPPEEAASWESLLLELAANGGLRKVQLYGKARPAPEDPKASPLPAQYLEERAASLRCAFSARGLSVPVEVYI